MSQLKYVAPTLCGAFRTTVSSGGDTPSYEMVFRFKSMTDLHQADDEWQELARFEATPSPADGLRESLDDAVVTIAAVRASTANRDEWADARDHLYSLCGATLARTSKALAASPAPAVVPAGMKLVPIDPTTEMREAGAQAHDDEECPVLIYKAMLAASPATPAGEG